jgi:thiol-disulfide isomerase/thioredoxin
MSMRTLLLMALFSLPASMLSAAASLDSVNLGTYVLGPKVSVQDLQGHVVLFEYWGVHCPPCLASIAHLNAMQTKFGRDNFIIVANHCQGEPAPLVQSTWQSKGGGDQVSVVMDGDLAGANVSSIPRCFLFDNEGKLVFDGSPFEVEDKVDAAIKASPGALVSGHEFHKLTHQVAEIGAMDHNLAGVLRALRKTSTGTDADAKSEADWLLDRLGTYTATGLSRITSETTVNPADAMDSLNRMVVLFRGDVLGKPFEDLQKQLKTDKVFQREYKAAGLLDQVNQEAGKIGLGSDPDALHRKQDCADILDELNLIASKYAGTKAAITASGLIKTWQLQ